MGKGSLYGTIDKPYPHMAEGTKNVKKGETKPTPRNFLVNPGKKGGYGYYHTTIGGKEYEWQNEPYGGVKKKRVGDIEHKPITRPFISTSHGDRLFDHKNTVYSMDGVKLRARSAPKSARAKTAPVPFKAMSPMGTTINKFPEYMIKPDPNKDKNPRDLVKHEKIWKPSGTNDLSIPSNSVCFVRIIN